MLSLSERERVNAESSPMRAVHDSFCKLAHIHILSLSSHTHTLTHTHKPLHTLTHTHTLTRTHNYIQHKSNGNLFSIMPYTERYKRRKRFQTSVVKITWTSRKGGTGTKDKRTN